MSSIIGTPPLREPAGEAWSNTWGNWFAQVRLICFAQQESGATANRPTKNLYPGRRYFDTSLGANGKPIWVNKAGTGWVLADGTAA